MEKQFEILRSAAAFIGILTASSTFADIPLSSGIDFIGDLRGGYDGVEIHPEAVEWCQRAITPLHPTFRFHRADLVSPAYNPHGLVPASEYRFPFPDQSFDFIFLASVFTHMLPDAVEHYLREIGRNTSVAT